MSRLFTVIVYSKVTTQPMNGTSNGLVFMNALALLTWLLLNTPCPNEPAYLEVIPRREGFWKPKLLSGNLNGYITAKASIACLPDLAHTALADGRNYLIRPQPGTR